MKTQKWFAMALALLTFVGFTACKDKSDDNDELLVITPSSLTLKVGEKATLTANAEDVTWNTSDEKVADLEGIGGKTITVVAIAKGSAIITATTSDGVTKTCVVAVTEEGGEEGKGAVIEATQIWPIILDATTFEANKDKVVADFRPNPEKGNNFNIWETGETYKGTDPTGLNFFGNSDGYTSLEVLAPNGWSGGGINITDKECITAAQSLRMAAAMQPDNYFLHLAIKSTDDATHAFWIFGSGGKTNAHFSIGKEDFVDQGNTFPRVEGQENFERDGAWHEFDIPLSTFKNLKEFALDDNPAYVFAFLSGGVTGTKLNLDAVYIYTKE